MKKAYAFLFAVAMFILTNTALAGEARITGYGTGEFAVKGIVAQQLEDKVLEPIRKQLSESRNVDVEITVIGFADKTGVSAANDRLGKDRAKEIESVLSDEFPDAKFVAITKGDEQDNRVSVVKWSFKPLAAVAPEKPTKADSENHILRNAFVIAVLTVVAVILGTLLDRSYRSKKKTIQKPSLPAEKISQTENIIEWIELTVGDKTYAVSMIRDDKHIWRSVIPKMNKPDECWYDEDKGTLRRTLIGCTRNHRTDYYGPIFEDLAKKGLIDEIKKGEGL